MRLVSYLVEGEPRFGAAVDSGVVDLTQRLGPKCPDLRSLIARDGLEVARQMVAGLKPSHALEDLVLLPPIPNPEKLWCIGVNYKDRNAESRACNNKARTPDKKKNSARPKYPSLFVRTPSSVVGSNQPIEKPDISE